MDTIAEIIAGIIALVIAVTYFALPVVYIILSIKTIKYLRQKNDNNIDETRKIFNRVSKILDSIDELKITTNYMCEILKSNAESQSKILELFNSQQKALSKISNDQMSYASSILTETRDNAESQSKILNDVKNNNSLTQSEILKALKSNADIVLKQDNSDSKIFRTDTDMSIELMNQILENGALLDDIDIIERKYEKQKAEYLSLLEAAKVLCEYYETNKHRDSKKMKSSFLYDTNTGEQQEHIQLSTQEKNTEQDEAMQRLNELIKKLYKIKEDQ